ncbi:MAG TPA: hypothetical protein VFU43_25235 [Streptosporangiaceae bacterium]|nr:hypothetical protein [Streptosporangiaceae bacterium]
MKPDQPARAQFGGCGSIVLAVATLVALLVLLVKLGIAQESGW